MPLEVTSEEIPFLVESFLKKYCEELHCPSKEVPANVMKAFRDYPWGGSLRDLENAVKRAVVENPRSTVLSEVEFPRSGSVNKARLDATSLEELLREKLGQFFSKWQGYEMSNLYDEIIRRVEKPLIELVLSRTGGNQVRAARMLGINRNTLYKKIKELGIILEERS